MGAMLGCDPRADEDDSEMRSKEQVKVAAKVVQNFSRFNKNLNLRPKRSPLLHIIQGKMSMVYQVHFLAMRVFGFVPVAALSLQTSDTSEMVTKTSGNWQL